MKLTFIIILRVLLPVIYFCIALDSDGQSFFCAGSEPFCTGTQYIFPAGVGGDAETGPYYDCLATQPNPAWYHMKIDIQGDIIIEMHSEPEKDIDFICWGPFDDAYEPCVLDLTADKVVDCSYSVSAYETVSVLSTSSGEYYILLITNYSDDPCNIIFSQTGGDGTTDCTILPPEASSNSPVCIGYDIELYAVSVINAEYEWYGPDGFYSELQNPVIYGAGTENMGTYTCKIHIGSQTNSTNIIVEVIDPPTAVIDGFEEICLGDEAVISFELTGTPPWKVYYTDGNEIFSVITDDYLTFETVSPTSSTTYTLSYLEDEVCSGNELSGSAVVIIHSDIQIRDTDTECNEANTHYTVTFEILGGEPESYYVLPEGGSISPGLPYIYTSELIPESTPFNYSAHDDYGCMEATTGGIQSCQCPASAEISGEFSICKEESAVLEIVLIGFPPWLVTYTQNSANPQDLIIDESPYYLEVSPDVTTAYAITYVEDIYCSGTGKGDANVFILPSPDTDFSFSPTCHDDTTFFTDLSIISVGEITGWLWDFDDGGASSILRNPQYKYSAIGTYEVELTATSDLGCIGSIVRTVSVNEAPGVTVCNDTAIYFQTSAFLTGAVEGGSGHYAYSWTPAYLVLEPFEISTETVPLEIDNDFILYGTDLETGCVSSDTVNVHISGAPLQIGVSADPPILCMGGFSQLEVNTVGGVEPFEYHWTSDPPGFEFNIPDPIVNPLETTVFTVLVSDGFSSIEDEVKIEVFPIPVVDAGPDQSIPDGWSAELGCDITGGSNPFVYQWSPSELLVHPDSGITLTVPLTAPALFNINVTDRWGCTADDEVLVEIEGGPLTASVFVSPSNSICKNDTVYLQVIANGGNTGCYQYTWKDHLANVLSSDSLLVHRPDSDITYFAEVFDGSVIITDSASVTVHSRPEVDIAPEEYELFPDRTIIVCIYDSVFLDAGNVGYNYLWSNGSSNQEIMVYTTGIGIDYQQHIVSVSNPETSCSTMDTLNIIFTFDACTRIPQIDNFDVNIYPNPVEDVLYIDYSSGTYPLIVSVFDVMGTELMKHEIKKQSKTENKLQIHFSDWADGIYFLIFTANFKSRSFKIVKL